MRARIFNKGEPSMLTLEPVSSMTGGAEPMYVCMYKDILEQLKLIREPGTGTDDTVKGCNL